MKSKVIKLLLTATTLISFMSCSTTIDKSKIIGSWYFVVYTDELFTKTELEEFENEIKYSPEGWIKHFNYKFNKKIIRMNIKFIMP